MSGLLLRRRGVIAASPADAGLFTDFSEYATGSPPSDWTKRWHADHGWPVEALGGATGGQVVEQDVLTSTLAARGLLAWDALDGAGDVEVVTRFRTERSSSQIGVLAFRAGGGPGGYWVHLTTQFSGRGLYLSRIASGAATQVGFSSAVSTQAGTWYWVRARAEGTALKVKAWAHGDSEPGWQIEVTDSNHASGWAGLAGGGGSPSDRREWDVFGAALNGKEAPVAA